MTFKVLFESSYDGGVITHVVLHMNTGSHATNVHFIFDGEFHYQDGQFLNDEEIRSLEEWYVNNSLNKLKGDTV